MYINLNGMDLKLGFPNIEFWWEGFGSKSVPNEPSLITHTFHTYNDKTKGHKRDPKLQIDVSMYVWWESWLLQKELEANPSNWKLLMGL